MIGVVANPAERDAAREFFELFKTPWEFCRSGGRYDVLLCTDAASLRGATAKLVLVYSAEKTPVDEDTRIQIASRRTNSTLSYGGSRIPIYGKSVTFRHEGIGLVTDERPRESAACLVRAGGHALVRVGYDLFREVRALLTEGQPPANAGIPALELHIALLRELITGCAISLVEIPPVPEGYGCIACLTHDIDHASIRRHKWDHTTFGFLYRACVGSLVNVCRGRASARDLLINWAAASRLPLIHLGLAKDFWLEFDRYLEIEPGAGSTFFVIPFKGYPGRTSEGEASGLRASRYEARDIADEVRRLVAAGCEIGVHGIDAWLDSSKGCEELEEVARITGAPDMGIRMHWLYGGEQSPAILEKAGFVYDSTNGYNETVGYRAGTTQVFKPLEATRLLELPLHVMDTALFYKSYLNLSRRQARERVGGIIDNALRFGGAVTLNWHDRSLAPERLWGRAYADVIDDLRSAGAWFATASRAVSWFRKRRSAVFESVISEPGAMRVRVSVDGGENLPGLRLRIHKARERRECDAIRDDAPDGYVDVGLRDGIDTCVRI